MRFVPHALEWVRALLFGTRKPDGYTTPDQRTQAPAYAVQPSPELWGALLALARLRRAGHAPDPCGDQHDQDATHPLVRTYVLPLEERQPAPYVWQLVEASR
ncbi:hypothetical protein [Streptomyces sp. SA15]|uniref:hypothetical protein n=1 Tax=Streptomyces sp. SA15 TaxID=934019 RepID=UPI00117BF069|nr:hypothetical protein [Streptomyces sp. SA15]